MWVVEVGSGKAREIAGGHAPNRRPQWMDARRRLFVSNRDGPSRGVYVARVGSGEVLDRKAFYLDSLRRRYRHPTRCC